ncbi:Zinc ABC transporter, periplasmic-binding protein ZnuA [uncultured Candidatus Thioglobus sp.]|nr:Zinc ABC transporter, periplasmic-binding protein ZnuA [uncultured Candidatus Thioglobus sp.]
MFLRCFLLFYLFSATAFAVPNVVSSIKPINSIVSSITQGVLTPKLLLNKTESAHHFHLKPSQLSLIKNADLIVSIHPKFELGLAKALNNIDSNKQIIVNADITNHHSWLDISLMQKLSTRVAKKLIKIDPSNAAIYRQNLEQTQQQLKQLKQQNSQALSIYRTANIATFSNSLIHFFHSNALKNPIIVNQKHNDKSSIYKIRKAKKAMKTQKTQCLLSTIEIPEKRIRTVIEGLDIRTARIDIIGLDVEYPQLMRNITQKIIKCLK